MTSRVQKEIVFNSHCREMAKNNVSLACNYIKSALTGAFTHPTNDSTTPIALKDRCMNFIKTPLLLLRAPLLYLPLINRVTQMGLRLLSPQLTADFVKLSPFCFTKAELKIRYNSNTISAFAIARLTYVAEKLLEKNIQENNEFSPETFTNKHLLDAYIKLFPPLSIDLISSPKFKEDEVKTRYSKDTRHKFIEDNFINKIRTKEEITKSDLNLSNDEHTIFINKLKLTYQECYNIFLNVLTQFSEKKCSVNLKKEVNQHKKNLLN